MADSPLKALFATDIDYEAETARRMGPYGQRAIDTSRVTFLPEPKTDEGLHGFYTKGPEVKTDYAINALRDAGLSPATGPDRVFLVGDRGADVYTSAHEFRHRAVPKMGERMNRAWDLWRADTPEDFRKAARYMYPEMDSQQAVREANRFLENNRDRFLAAEEQSMQRGGQVAPKRGIFERLLHPKTSDERAFVENQAEIRHNLTHPSKNDGPGVLQAIRDPEFWSRDVLGHAIGPLAVAAKRFEAISDPKADPETRRAATKAVFDQLGPAGITKIGKGAVRIARDPDIGVRFWDLAINQGEKQVGELLGYIRNLPGIGDAMQVTESFITKGNRGQGLGVRAYQQAADEAHAAGMAFTSDTVVSASASRAYDALNRRGYQIIQNPTARFVENAWESGNGAPVFQVLPRSR